MKLLLTVSDNESFYTLNIWPLYAAEGQTVEL